MSRPLHVCFVSQEYPPETGWGGIGAYTYEMAHGLVAAGQKVTVISRAMDGEETVEDTGGVIVHRVRYAPNLDRMRVIWRLNRYWPGFAWAALKRIRKIHAEEKVDIVEAAENRADGFFLTMLWSHSPVIVRLHVAWIFVDRLNRVAADRKKRLIYWLEKQSILRADALSAPCQAMVDLTRSWIPLRGRDVTVLPNPVDAEYFQPRGDDRKSEVLYTGRLERRKLAILADALPDLMRHCPETHFRFAGADGPDENGQSWQERLLASVPAGERYRLHFGQTPRDRMGDLYRAAAFCVAPSIWENFPYAALEAMACGTPVVATRVGGFPEIIEDGISGLLVAPEDPAALVKAVSELVESPSRQRDLGRGARRSAVERLSVAAVVPRMLDFYRSVQ
jgi:glycogen(starch) synthase